MKIAIANLESISPYSSSRKHDAPKIEKESHADYEKRTWREKGFYNDEGFWMIPSMAFKFAIATAAKFLRMRIPGKGNSEYGKHFNSGIIVPENLILPVKKEMVEGIWLSCHANGNRGSGTRVDRCFPIIGNWSGAVEYYVLDDNIPKEVFEIHLRESGNFVGCGRFRPENGGFNGRFKVTSVKWKDF